MHETNLSIILEDESKFGVPIILIDKNDIEYELTGQCNIISRSWDVDAGSDISGERSNITIRLSTFLTKTNIDIDDIKTELINWKIKTTPQPEKQQEKIYIIEEGGIFPDFHLGVITFFLTEIEII